MRRFSQAAKQAGVFRLLALAAALAAPTQGAAQSADPFALPKGTTIAAAQSAAREGPGLSAIAVDGRMLTRMVELKYVGEALAIDAQSAQTAGLPVPERATGFVALDDIPVATWSFDRLSQRLEVKLLRNRDGPNDIDVARRNLVGGERSPLFAALVDYDFTVAMDSSGNADASALVAPRLNYGNAQVASAFQYIGRRPDGLSALVRLDTQATLALPARNLLVTAGDVLTAGAESQRALRIGGLQVSTDFALRPDLITTPLPDFYGNVAVPTALDIIVNDQRLESQQIEAGEYQVRNIPVTPGRGEVSVIVRDELGREVVQSARIYVARDMLAPGLWQGAANVGWIRRRYGEVSNDYRTLVGTFFLRRGLSRSLSLGVSGEIGAGVKNVGGQIDATVFDRAVVFSEMRYSRTAQDSGYLVRGGIESIGERFSARIDAIWPSRGYRDVASLTGDALPPRQVTGSFGYDINETYRFQVTASRQWQPADTRYARREQRIDFARAGIRMPIGERFDFTADAGYRRSRDERGTRSGLSATLGLSWRLGGSRSAMASVTRSGAKTYGRASFYKGDIEPGDIGYGVRALIAERPALSGMIAWRNRYNALRAEADYLDGAVQARASATGTLIFTDNTLFARNRNDGSYALVRTGTVAGVTVTRENRIAGVTDRQGRLLIENVAPLVPMQFDVDPNKLPPDAVAKATYKRVIVARGGVAEVTMDVKAYRSQALRLIDRFGQPLPAGVGVVGDQSGDGYTVGYDGIVDFNTLSGDRTLIVAAPGGRPCRFALPDIRLDGFDMPELRVDCYGAEIAARASESRGATSLSN